jgi:hypothetical protein
MIKELLVVALVLGLTIVFVRIAYPIVRAAIRTGRLLARGTVYDLEKHPKMFFGGLAFWILFSLFLIGLTVFSIRHAFKIDTLYDVLKAGLAIAASLYVSWVIWRMVSTGIVMVRWVPYGWKQRPLWFFGSLASLGLVLLPFLLLASAAMIKRLL